MRMSDLVDGDYWQFGNYAATGWGIVARLNGKTVYYNGGIISVSKSRASGVWALAGPQGYYNGSPDGAPTTGVAAPTAALYIGDVSGPYRRNMTGNVQAMAIYSGTLTATEVATVSAAMAAL
jgi:hypothetical protein